MKSCGVIVEYNPFHNGHQYHLERARQTSKADVVIAVMSGNFLQRGEPAILDKWQRANQALLNGADLVIELPFAYAVQSADYFARGGVKLLQAMEVDALCFGTDIEEQMDYEKFGAFHQENRSKIDEAYQLIKNNGQSYPQQMTEVYRKLLPEWTLDFSSPNHILGMGYAKENTKYPTPMTLYPIKRLGNNYHDKELNNQQFASATSIRQSILSGKKEESQLFLSEVSYQDLLSNELVDWEKAWSLLKYKIVTSTISELGNNYQMVEGLEYRFKDMVSGAQSFSEFVEKVKSKRYTWTRIQRLCLYVLLQVKEEDIKVSWDHSYLRVLGFNNQGREFLKEKKKKMTLPLVTNINQKNEKLLTLDIKAGQVYSLLNQSQEEQDYYRAPIYLK